MFIIWSGWGILVIVFGAIGVFGSILGIEALGPAIGLVGDLKNKIGLSLPGLIAAGLNYLFVAWRERGRIITNDVTGERIVLNNGPGSLFFIPMRYWTWILLALQLVMIALMWLSPSGP